MGKNNDTNYIIPTYRGYIPGTPHRYIGRSNIQFHLATIDPNGKPTHGITRTRSYLGNNAGDEAKLDEWPPTQYLNVYIINNFSGAHSEAAAYSIYPSAAAANPYGDGPIGLYSYFNASDTTRRGTDWTLAHEIGHSLDLIHTFGQTNDPQNNPTCSDDNVDDTPPTVGHLLPGYPGINALLFTSLADTTCNWLSTNIAKYSITAPLSGNASDTLTTQGITFNTRTRIVIDTLTFYPKTDTSTTNFQPVPYSIILINSNNVTVGSYVDTIRSHMDTVRVSVKLKADPGNGYVLRFAKNPGARRDAAGGIYTRNFPGGMTITSDSSADHKYNYFYNIQVDYGYFKVYGNDSLVDYPDTTNSQNYMDYTYDNHMFSYGQVRRMRAALNNSVAGRNNLISDSNLVRTGVYTAAHTLAPFPKVVPIPDYYTYGASNAQITLRTKEIISSPVTGFTCADGNTATALHFVNQTYEDTATSIAWSFDHGANPSTYTVNSVAPFQVSFSNPGWVRVELDATNSAGTNKLIDTNSVYAADPTPLPSGFVQEFSGDNSRWPIFNYFGTDHKWEVLNNVGFLDNSCIRFTNFDTRQFATASNQTLTPSGIYADYVTPPYDLSGYGTTGACNLAFNSAGTYRTTNAAYMNDTLEIEYSTTCGSTWTRFSTLARAQLANNGYQLAYYTPASYNDWMGHVINIPAAARTTKTFFRFRFVSGSDNGALTTLTYGTGNNFYMDRILITANSLGVTPQLTQIGMTLAPNPTSGSAVVTLKGGDNSLAQLTVTDITGKVVYRTEARLNSAATQIEIPASVIAVKGMYLVQAVTNGNALTQKLVVY